MEFWKADGWKNPENRHRVNIIVHEWNKNRNVQLDAIAAFGFGGVVTNPSHRGSYQDFLNSIPQLKTTIGEMEKRNLGFWLYDEFGYPSGYAGGETLRDHPELEAKGFFMRRYVAYENRTVRYHLDDDADKIIWAAKYPMDVSVKHESIVQYHKMEAVSFSDDYVECEMKPNEALFIFCVKSAYEGSQCTHNTCSYSRYINILDKKAVERFIALMFEPILSEIPDAFSRAAAVFTDEPSLMVGYSRDYETWTYAIAPWVDGLFDRYEERYAEDIRPMLPLLFEGGMQGACVRSRFYKLIGEIAAEAYTETLQNWCSSHGGCFSGHYLGEETAYGHVLFYGSYTDMLLKTGYPGLDVLNCVPERYDYTTAKFPQMAARKMGAKGLMAEICPFGFKDEFNLAPFENMCGLMGLLYLSGVRVTNSYFTSNLEEYDPVALQGVNGYMSKAQANLFNGYIGRMSHMLENADSLTDTFVYYGYEDVSAKFVPHHTAYFPPHWEYDGSNNRIIRTIFENGCDFGYIDADDLKDSKKDGKISGIAPKTIIVPAIDVMDEEAFHALMTFKNQGVNVFFFEKTPSRTTDGKPLSDEMLCAATADEILKALNKDACIQPVKSGKFFTARFKKDGKQILMLVNGEREEKTFRINTRNSTLLTPETGETRGLSPDSEITLNPLRAYFIIL